LNYYLEEIYCSHNQLTSLPELNHQLKKLHCQCNKLTSLPELNEHLQELYCSFNLLTFLPKLNVNLRMLYCSDNQIIYLPLLNKGLNCIHCYKNQLITLPNLNEKLEFLSYHDNPIIYQLINHNDSSKIILGNDLNILKQQVKTINNIIYSYYCLKFKKQFKKWLWELVREPKIIKKFHPSYLIENLNEKDDLDEFLEKWITT
jgi:Leucine-rich repeat (LRR) protein